MFHSTLPISHIRIVYTMNQIKKWEWFRYVRKPKRVMSLIMVTMFITLLILYYLTWQIKQSNIGFWNKYFNYNALYEESKGLQFNAAKVVHIDLKGAPPKVSYLKKLFPLLKKLNATDVLIEYEDMFPYSGPLLSGIPAYNAYSLEDISEILECAAENNLTVIPLIQTFGHMEFILKLEEFVDYREVPEYPQVICPTHPSTLELVMEMVDQIIRAHPNITMLHIGADEVYYIGKCDRCRRYLNSSGLSTQQLFLQHVSVIVKKIRSKYPLLRILTWDDHYRQMSIVDLEKSQIGSLIEPVIWKYTANVDESLDYSMWNVYAVTFPRIWIASAFKGATGSKQFIPNILHHIQNHVSWLTLVDTYKHKIKFEGIFLTGWQRYDHFAVLCELLPVSIPSLAMCINVLSGYKDPHASHSNLIKILECNKSVDTMFGVQDCHYPGGALYDIMYKFRNLKESFQSMLLNSKVEGWVDNYNVKNSFSNPFYVKRGLSNLESLIAHLRQLQLELYTSMMPIYDNYTIDEWYQTYMWPLFAEMQSLLNAKKKLLSQKFWPRRPFTPRPLTTD